MACGIVSDFAMGHLFLRMAETAQGFRGMEGREGDWSGIQRSRDNRKRCAAHRDTESSGERTVELESKARVGCWRPLFHLPAVFLCEHNWQQQLLRRRGCI